ncbi:hypothetical protein AVEN_130999-1, partial [Araneus ventricosus]
PYLRARTGTGGRPRPPSEPRHPAPPVGFEVQRRPPTPEEVPSQVRRFRLSRKVLFSPLPFGFGSFSPELSKTDELFWLPFFHNNVDA